MSKAIHRAPQNFEAKGGFLATGKQPVYAPESAVIKCVVVIEDPSNILKSAWCYNRSMPTLIDGSETQLEIRLFYKEKQTGREYTVLNLILHMLKK